MSDSRPPGLGARDAEPVAGWIEPAPAQGGLARIARAIVSRPWVVPLAIVLALCAALAYLATAEDVYEAEADVLLTPVPGDTASGGFGLILDTSDPARATETVARLVTTPTVALRVKSDLKLDTSAHQLLGQVSAKPVAQSDLVAITAKAPDGAQAARLADGFGAALIESRTERLHQAVDVALKDVEGQIASVGTTDNQQRNALLARQTDLRTLRQAPDPSLELATNAAVPSTPVSPRPLLSIAGAILAGAILGVLGVLALEYVDPRLWREEQLSASYRLPILARIPRQRTRASGPLGPERISPSAADGYRTLRANLPSAARRGSGRRLPVGAVPEDSGDAFSAAWAGREGVEAKGCVMVTSASPGDGKTTTALNLAATLASVWDRVILIEADTARPSIRRALGLAEAPGLGSVLSEQVFLADALVPVELASGTMHVLLADPPGGRDTLSHSAGGALLDEASGLADWVVVDLPPLNQAPDVLPLVRAATELLITVRLRHTNLRSLGRLSELLVRQGVVPAGFVLVGTPQQSGYA
jgi:Mrp family chromosome partitioning ATPase/capsular polysaccharide biosynthesis protein